MKMAGFQPPGPFPFPSFLTFVPSTIPINIRARSTRISGLKKKPRMDSIGTEYLISRISLRIGATLARGLRKAHFPRSTEYWDTEYILHTLCKHFKHMLVWFVT